MIQADENYVYGSTAEKISYDVYEENKVLKSKRKQRANYKLKVKLVFYLMLVLATGLTIIYRYAVITQLNYKIVATQKEYEDIKNVNIQLNAEMEKELDLQNVKEIAVSKLGMQTPDKYQIIYFKIPKSDFTDVSEQYMEMETADGSVISALKDKVNNVVGFLY